ncbi:uncharacterized protein LOC128670785 [Plodia interpunctella]|uniref:uncharacterized protein LOC128670785 n=1 Tax=Plodia interpunctella TaxID=58824 RepID=UPI0023680342|nr:uncharacterized protein LOC128670785 [Plodia interpunctella]
MGSLVTSLLLVLPLLCDGRIISVPRQRRLTSAESVPSYYYTNINGVPGTYSFGYDSFDPATGNTQYRTEERYPNGTVVGSYGFVDARGVPQRFKYVADQSGYRVMSDPVYNTVPQPIELMSVEPTEPSITWTRPRRPNKSHRNKGTYFTKIPIEKNTNFVPDNLF